MPLHLEVSPLELEEVVSKEIRLLASVLGSRRESTAVGIRAVGALKNPSHAP